MPNLRRALSLACAFLVVGAIGCTSSPSTPAKDEAASVERPGLTPMRDDCFLLKELGSARVTESGSDCGVAAAPASTFKIPHAIIALETKAVRPGEVIDFDRERIPFESWKSEHDLESAIRSSVYPLFRVVAARIGAERMRDGLARLRYAKDGFEGDPTSFWTDGDLVVTPREQLDFLGRMFSGALVADRRKSGATDAEALALRDAVDFVSRALTMPEGTFTNAAGSHPFDPRWGSGTIVRAKSGNTQAKGIYISWLVGEIEHGRRKWVFVSRRRSIEPLKTTDGAELALGELRKVVPRR